MWIKIHPALERVLDHTPRNNLTFRTTEYGAPFKVAGFGNWFRDRAREAGLNGCTPHGLRKAMARRLAEASNSTQEIQAVTGHTTRSEVERYTRDASQIELADRAINSLPDGTDKEQNLSNLSTWLDKK